MQIVVAGVINGSIANKYILKLFKPHLEREKSKTATAWWVGLCALIWLGAWVLAESIPVFEELLSLVSALLGSWFTCRTHLALLGIIPLTNAGRWHQRRPLASPQSRQVYRIMEQIGLDDRKHWNACAWRDFGELGLLIRRWLISC